MAQRDISAVPYCFGAAEAVGLPGPVLSSLLLALGHTPTGAKALLHRLSGWGLVSSTRHGRVAVHRLAGQLAEGYQLVVSPQPQRVWGGTFHTLVYDIPESRRRERDQLRAAAVGHGYRQLRPGVLVSPYDRSAGFLPAFPGVVAGQLRLSTEAAAVVAERCWDLAASAVRMDALASDLETAAGVAAEPREAFVRLHALMSPAVSLLLADAQLPQELLGGAGLARTERLARAMGTVSDRLGPQAAAYVDEVVEASGHAALVEREPRSVSPRS